MYTGLLLIWTIMIALFWMSGYVIMAFGTKDGKPNKPFIRSWTVFWVIAWIVLTFASL
jgi:hypothetical protein